MEGKQERVIRLVDHFLNQTFGSLRVYKEGNEFLVPWGSTVINVEVVSEEEEVKVRVYSPVALRVKPDKDLMRFMLVENGSLEMCSFWVEFENGLMDIVIGVKLGSDLITKEVITHTCIKVGNLANEYGKEIIAVFGGISFKEYVERQKLKKRPSGEDKILHDIFEVEGLEVCLELYRAEGEVYTILGKIPSTGQIFLKAERSKDIKEVFALLESIKEALLKRDIPSLRKMLKHYEMEDYILYNVVVGKEEDRIRRLKEIEQEIQTLTEMLMRGEISQEEYRRRMSDIERSMGL